MSYRKRSTPNQLLTRDDRGGQLGFGIFKGVVRGAQAHYLLISMIKSADRYLMIRT